jgi:hypothetical protein
MTFYPPPDEPSAGPPEQTGQWAQPPTYPGQAYPGQTNPAQTNPGQMPPPYGQPYGQPGYGAPGYPPPPGYSPYPAPQPGNGIAIAAMVCALVGLLFFGVVLGPLGVIFGSIGLGRAKRGASGRGMAITGIVVGIIDVLAFVVLLAVLTNHNSVFG